MGGMDATRTPHALPGDPPTPVAELAPTLQRLRGAWQARRPDYAQRRDDLRRLRAALKARLTRMAEAIAADFGHRPRQESLLADGMPVLAAIDHLLAHLRGWMRPQRVMPSASCSPPPAWPTPCGSAASTPRPPTCSNC